MMNTNARIEEELANGTPCRGLYIKFKKGCKFVRENWEGYLVNTVFANQVDYIMCMHEGKNAKYFIVKPETRQCKVKLRTWNNTVLDKIKITYLPINLSISTTCHKLQGVSLDSLVIDTFNYRLENWVYVVLSRVTTRNGLVLCEKLDINRDFKVNEVLSKWEKRIQNELEKKLFIQRGQLDEYLREANNCI